MLVDVSGPLLGAVEAPGVVDGAIFVIGGQDLIIRLQIEGTGYNVDAVGCIVMNVVVLDYPAAAEPIYGAGPYWIVVIGDFKTAHGGLDGVLKVLLDIEVVGALAPSADVAVYFAPNSDAGFLLLNSSRLHLTGYASRRISPLVSCFSAASMIFCISFW